MTGGGERPQFLTVAEVAEAMRVSRMTVYRLVHSGELPAIRVGKSYRVPQAALAAYIEQSATAVDRRVAGTSAEQVG